VRKLLCTSLCLLVIALLGVSAHAQSQATTGEVNGRVTDAQGGVLPGATVTLTNPANGYTRAVVTGPEGYFVAPLLPPGSYDASFEMNGLQSVKRKATVTVGASVTLNVSLGVGGVREEVTVVSEAPLVETTSTVRTSTLDQNAIANLPINGRRFQDFITLTPTVQVDPQRGQLSFSGQRGINSNISVDGADYNQPFFGGIRGGERSNTAFTIPQEAIQEFQVASAGYSAEFGRSTGGLVNAITKSGTNQIRGSAFYLNRNKEWAETNAFGQKAAPTQQQFGGSVGGPLQKDKAFFFAAFERQLFTNTRQVLFDRLAAFTPTAATQEAFNYYKSLETPFEATNDAWTALGRIDYQFNSANRLSVRYSHSDNTALNANATGNALDPNTISALSNNGTEKDNTNIIVGQLTSSLSPNLLLEVRGQWAREERPRLANEGSPTVQTAIGNFGTVNFLPTTQFDKRYQAAVNLTLIKSRHTVKVGTEYNHVFADQTFGFNQFGRWTVNGTDTATLLDSLAPGGTVANRFDTNQATYLLQLGNLLANYSTDEVAVFAQDTWKVKPNFTVNAGLRWEGSFNPTPEANNPTLVNQVKGFGFPVGRSTDPTAKIPNQLDQFGPRLGFAWDPTKDGRTAVRGYTGIYYARTPALLYAGPMNNYRQPPGDLSLQLPLAAPGNPNNTLYRQLLLIGIDLNRTPLNQLPILTPAQATQIGTALGLTVNPFIGAQPLSMDNDFKNPRAFQVGFGAERQVAGGVTVGLDGTFVKTDRLQRNRELNLPVPVVRATDPAQRPFFGLTTGTQRPLPLLGSVQVRESTARSKYVGATFSAKLQRRRVTANLYYVLSKSDSDDDNERDSGGPGSENTFNLDPEYGPARLDRRHQVNGFVVFMLPAGFDVSSGFRFLSGRPIDVGVGSDANGDRITAADRPFSAPGVPFTRNAFRNESLKFLNIRVQWKLDLKNDRKLVFSAEAFNVFNWDNIELSGSAVTNYCAAPVPLDCGFAAPSNPNFLSLTDNVSTSPRFGQLLLNNNPGEPRQVQLGVRLQF
jgi:Carboxypeptidase regulatory-like domain/TonB dependent receptor